MTAMSPEIAASVFLCWRYCCLRSILMSWAALAFPFLSPSRASHLIILPPPSMRCRSYKSSRWACGRPGGNSARPEKAALNRCPVLIKPLIEQMRRQRAWREDNDLKWPLAHSWPGCGKSPQLRSWGECKGCEYIAAREVSSVRGKNLLFACEWAAAQTVATRRIDEGNSIQQKFLTLELPSVR
ncbi:hypothetical protein N656DRAFT_613525 [Canariomyces notabilis]|uniref:Uncharacterized protein n=1 Tax=Canariomyces notabilis TaxID=2074819 RepID=A0AAN6YT56_9PEZI|nr:hypothetical protein N656DRAFT_613525 [Canariomyces arenarius]